jgi:hypothetical protein
MDIRAIGICVFTLAFFGGLGAAAADGASAGAGRSGPSTTGSSIKIDYGSLQDKFLLKQLFIALAGTSLDAPA